MTPVGFVNQDVIFAMADAVGCSWVGGGGVEGIGVMRGGFEDWRVRGSLCLGTP